MIYQKTLPFHRSWLGLSQNPLHLSPLVTTTNGQDHLHVMKSHRNEKLSLLVFVFWSSEQHECPVQFQPNTSSWCHAFTYPSSYKDHSNTSTAEVSEWYNIDTSDDNEESVTDFNCSDNVLKTEIEFSHSCLTTVKMTHYITYSLKSDIECPVDNNPISDLNINWTKTKQFKSDISSTKILIRPLRYILKLIVGV